MNNRRHYCLERRCERNGRQVLKGSIRYTWMIVTILVINIQRVNGIVAGKYAKEEEYPYAAIIFKNDKVKCGGVLVALNYVFTGCHCVGKWTKLSEGSTRSWEPNQTAYYFNFSTSGIDRRTGRRSSAMYRSATQSYQNQKGQINESTSDIQPNISSTNPTIEPKNATIEVTNATIEATNATIEPTNATNPTEAANASAETTNPTSVITSPDEKTTSGENWTEIDVATNNTSLGTDSTPIITKSTITAPEKTFSPFLLSEVYMVAGTVWIYKFSRGQLRGAGNSYKHPRCSDETTPWNYDFGIYRATKSFVFDEIRIAPMRIYHQDNEIFRRKFQSMIKGGEVCKTIGWGTTQLLRSGINPYDDTFNRTAVNVSEKLKHTDVKLINDELCNELLCFPPYNFCNGSDFQWADVGIVCALHVSRGDSCDKDDGNALVCDGHVFGFANSGLDCMANVPRFYTRLDYALDFYYSSINFGTSFNCFSSYFTLATAVVSTLNKMTT